MEQNSVKFWKEFAHGLTFTKHNKSSQNVIPITLLEVWPCWTILKFGRNEETCTVLNGRQVSYKGEEWFLSNLTNKLCERALCALTCAAK